MLKVAVFLLAFAVTYKLLPSDDGFHEGLIRGKRVLVTGASKGIGEQIAYEYARHGASVFITSRKDAELKQVILRCKQLGSSSAVFGYMAMDMMQPELSKKLIESAVSSLGGLDIVILNHAYIPKWDDFTEHSFDDLERTLRVNVMAYAQVLVHSMPHLIDTQGAVGVLSSMAGKIPNPYAASYVASKFAVDGFFASLREEILHTNVTITNCVLGLIGTDTLKGHLEQMPKTFNVDLKDVMEGPWSPEKPEDTAKVIVRGVALRKREIYFPGFIKYLVYFRELLIQFDIFPRLTK